MPFVFKRLALLMSIAAAFAADKPALFKAPPAAELAQHQTNGKVTVGAKPFETADEAHTAFGKLDPNTFGILPVLVVIQNDSAESIRLDQMKVEYNSKTQKMEPIPAKDVRYVKGGKRPTVVSIPGKAKGINKKNPLDAFEIEGRAFAAQMLAPGQSASGFFYFDTHLEVGATIYLTGLYEPRTNKDLLFFEMPLNSNSPDKK